MNHINIPITHTAIIAKNKKKPIITLAHIPSGDLASRTELTKLFGSK